MLSLFNTILVHPLFNLLALIYAVIPGHDFGLAIIILTILVRLALWPLVTKQLRSQKALQDLQPEIAKLKEKAKGDRTLEGKLIMELYKEREVNPFGSLVTVFIQLPLLLALFSVLKDVVKPGEFGMILYEPLRHLGALADIIKAGPHTSFEPKFLSVIDLHKASPILAALAGAAQFYQTKQLIPKNQVKDATTQATASLVYVFPILTFFVGLSLPAALALYWTSASLVLILQQYLILREDVRDLEEGVIVTNPTPAPKKAKKGTKRGRA